MELVLLIIIAIIFFILFIVNYNKKNKLESTINAKTSQINNLQTVIKQKDIIIKQKEAQFLKSSINPHLFNNALGIITNKTEGAISQARRVIKTSEETLESIDVLTNVLRYIIYESKDEYVLLTNEIEFIKEYIKLQKLRINPKFNIQIDTETLSSMIFNKNLVIAPLISIDFIENAFKYTNTSIEEGFITIKFELHDNTLLFSVRNSKNQHKIKPSSGGFGLDNLYKRLDLLYKDKYHIDISDKEETFSANLKIELHEKN